MKKNFSYRVLDKEVPFRILDEEELQFQI